MKKVLFAALAGVAVLASCAKTEVVKTSDSVNIRFDNAYVGNPTKATVNQITEDQFDNFYVLATTTDNPTFFNNEKVYLENGVYTYDVLKLWKPGAGYAFAAYSNGGYAAGTDGKLENVSFANGTLTITDYTVLNDDKRDLVASISSTNLEDVNTPVQFGFNHALAMVKFTLVNGLGENEIQITDFSVIDVPNTATMTLDADGMEWGATSAVTTFTSADFTCAANGEGVSDEFVVIPVQNGTSLEISFTATVTPTNGGDESVKTLTATIDTYQWQAGMRYNYKATITASDMDYIEFADPTVTPWDDYTDFVEDIDKQ